MKNQIKMVYLWLCVGLVMLAASCSSDNTQTAHLQVMLTDAPGDYEEVNVDIQEVQLNGDANATNSGWKSVSVNKVYNLLDFTNGVDTLLASLDLPAGKVSQIRLILGTNNSVKIGGQSFNLSTPSAQQSGLKVLVNTALQAGVTYKITLDFDAARSIVQTGSAKYILKPVIRPVVTAESGAIKGLIDPAVSTPAIYAYGKDTASTSADLTGHFLFKGLDAGTYTVIFQPKTGYKADTVKNVSVTVGTVTDMGTVKISPQ